MNKAGLGLHAWGNIVPACQACNNRKGGGDWRDFTFKGAKEAAAERKARVRQFVDQYEYSPSFDLRDVAEELYEEVGSVAMTLVNAKTKRVRERL